jgi:hypothetical protein
MSGMLTTDSFFRFDIHVLYCINWHIRYYIVQTQMGVYQAPEGITNMFFIRSPRLSFLIYPGTQVQKLYNYLLEVEHFHSRSIS